MGGGHGIAAFLPVHRADLTVLFEVLQRIDQDEDPNNAEPLVNHEQDLRLRKACPPKLARRVVALYETDYALFHFPVPDWVPHAVEDHG